MTGQDSRYYIQEPYRALGVTVYQLIASAAKLLLPHAERIVHSLLSS